MDFTVLTIILVTLLAVTGVVTLPDLSSQRQKLLICVAAWTIPLIMSITAVSLNLMEPIGWNWCWISPERQKIRYALAQCWWLAIVFLTIPTYSFIWCFVHRRCAESLFPQQSACRRYTADETYNRVKSSDHESIRRPSSEAVFPFRSAALAKLNTKESDLSEFMLPIQGLKRSIDGNADIKSLSANARQHGTIATSGLRPSVSAKGTPQGAPPGPNYHNQCPKVTRSFDVAMSSSAPQLPVGNFLPSVTADSTGPNYNSQHPKAARSYDNVTQSSEAGNEYNKRSRYYKHYPKDTNTTSSNVLVNPQSPSMASSGTLPQGNSGPASPYHGGGPDSAKAFNVLSKLAETHTDSSSETIPQLARGTGPRYHNQCPKVQRSFEVVTAQSQEKPQPSPGSRYFNRYLKAAQTVDVETPSPEGPSYSSHHQRRTDSVPPRASADSSAPPSAPPPPPMVLRPDSGANITTTVTSPVGPPPSPTPGLPPPPWSPGMDSPRRRTFFLSRSTWSDLLSAPERRIASGGGAARRHGRSLEPCAARRALLPLAAYPLAYAVLSLPGVVRCLLDAPADYEARAMALLLGTGQYVGLAHAIVFAVVEVLSRRARVRRGRLGVGTAPFE